MTTNLLLVTDDKTYADVRDRVTIWHGAIEVFNEAKSIARDAAIEFTLNEMGLTMYRSREDTTLMSRMDEYFGGLNKESRERWCESGVCGCMGCVNHAAYKNGITKHQWRIWVLARTPGLAEQWAAQEAYWAGVRAKREEEERVRQERAAAHRQNFP